MDFPSIAKRLPWRNGVRLLATDAFGLLAVDKPTGVLSHPNRSSEMGKSLLSADRYDATDRAYLFGSDGFGVERAYLINRLDSATSGVLLLALDATTRDAVLSVFDKKQVEKVYEALVFGALAKGPPLWRDRLNKKRRGETVRGVVGAGKVAETKLLAAKATRGIPLMSRLKLMPITGRTHQLRIQTAKRGVPIVGDRTYGDFSKNKLIAQSRDIRRLCLHCSETRLVYNRDGRKVGFEARSRCPF